MTEFPRNRSFVIATFGLDSSFRPSSFVILPQFPFISPSAELY